MQDILVDFLQEILISGLFVVAGGIIVLELSKSISWVRDNDDLLPCLVIPVCMALGVVLPAFSDLDTISQAIAGGVCGIVAPVIYDKWVKPIKNRINPKKDDGGTQDE